MSSANNTTIPMVRVSGALDLVLLLVHSNKKKKSCRHSRFISTSGGLRSTIAVYACFMIQKLDKQFVFLYLRKLISNSH